MKRVNWRLFNIALWIEVALAYILPFKVINNFEFRVGFPISFIAIYDTAISHNPMMSMYFNPIALLVDTFIIYFIILGVISGYNKLKSL